MWKLIEESFTINFLKLIMTKELVWWIGTEFVISSSHIFLITEKVHKKC